MIVSSLWFLAATVEDQAKEDKPIEHPDGNCNHKNYDTKSIYWDYMESKGFANIRNLMARVITQRTKPAIIMSSVHPMALPSLKLPISTCGNVIFSSKYLGWYVSSTFTNQKCRNVKVSVWSYSPSQTTKPRRHLGRQGASTPAPTDLEQCFLCSFASWPYSGVMIWDLAIFHLSWVAITTRP